MLVDNLPDTNIGDCRRKDRGPNVKWTQEWLCLHDHKVTVDSDFGAATEAAVNAFQKDCGGPGDGIVGPKTRTFLQAPLQAAVATLPAAATLGDTIVAYAKQHLKQHPREAGGQNRGPWVRLYMLGREGEEWAWCAGFACYVMRQAALTHGVNPPVEPHFACDNLAANARAVGRFVPEADAQKPGAIKPGSFFLKRKVEGDWVHTGIVTTVGDGWYGSIEGNTNDDGSREGYEVCARRRGFASTDFILF